MARQITWCHWLFSLLDYGQTKMLGYPGGLADPLGKGSTECTIDADSQNTINNSPSSTIVWGNKNSIKNSDAGMIRGCQENQVTGDFAVVGGGQQNIASGQGSVIPGGRQNKACGAYSFAFGRREEASDTRWLVINLQEGGGQLKS